MAAKSPPAIAQKRHAEEGPQEDAQVSPHGQPLLEAVVRHSPIRRNEKMVVEHRWPVLRVVTHASKIHKMERNLLLEVVLLLCILTEVLDPDLATVTEAQHRCILKMKNGMIPPMI